MSTGLVTINTHTQIAPPPAPRGSFFGGGSRLFKLKPANVELQQKTSRAEGSLEGKFRNASTGEHYEELNLVIIFEPTEPRSMYENQNDFGKPPLCYSMDGVTPSDKAQQPQARYCERCRHSDWTKWKKSRNSADLPKCKTRYSAFAVDRKSKIPFRLGVRGKSTAPFREAMGQIASLAELYFSEHGKYPEVYDFTFTVKSVRKVDNKGVYYVMEFKDIKLIHEDDRAEFGAIYTRYIAERQERETEESAEEAAEDVSKAMTEATADPSGPVEGEYVESQEPVTI